MATVSEVVLKYAAKGAKQAQRADEKVRRGIEQTQKTAQKSAGRVNRWMQANRSAIKMIAGATLAFLGALIAASPLARDELGLMRSSFGILADTILQPLLPALTAVSLAILDLSTAIADLPPSLRLVVSISAVAVPAIFGLAFAITAASAAAAAAGISFGALFISLSAVLGIPILIAAGLLLLHRAMTQGDKTAGLLAGVILGVLVPAILVLLGVMGPITAVILGITVAIALLTAAWVNNWFDIQGKTEAAVAAITGFLDATVEFFTVTIPEALQALADWFGSVWDGITGTVRSAVNTLMGWIQPLLDAMRSVVRTANRASRAASNVVGGAANIIGLQHGGIVTEPTLAMIGEAGPEAVVPLNQGGGGGPVVAGGDTVTVVVESGAVQVQGSIRDEADVDRLVSEVAERLGGRLGRRGSGV